MKRSILVVLALTAATGCSLGAGSSATRPAASASPTGRPAASASPSAQPAASPGPSSSACRLPISIKLDGGSQGAFLSYPSGEVTIDPAGKGGRYYDRAFSRWLPVEGSAVSPDGSQYAYSEQGTAQGGSPSVHVVDVRTGQDRAFVTPSSHWFISYIPLAFRSDGVYLGQAWESPTAGLWRLDPGSGSLTMVASISNLEIMASTSVFWVGTVNPADPSPLSGIATQANQIDRLDLADGRRTPWFYRPGMAVSGVGLDGAGHPIVRALAGKDGVIQPGLGGELFLLLDQRTQVSLYKGSGQQVETLQSPVADSHGIWFGSSERVFLYTPADGLKKVSSQPASPAGICV